MRALAFALALSAACAGSVVIARDAAAEASRVVGPMTGHVTMRSAHLWAQWVPSAGEVEARVGMHVEYWPQGEPQAMQRSATVVTGPANDWNARWQLAGLEAGRRYEYRVVWRTGDRQGHGETATLSTEPLWQWRTDPPPLRVIAGSCAYTNDAADDRPGEPYGRAPGIYDAMAAQAPDVTLWMGDNVYLREPDFDDVSAMSARYAKWRRIPELQALLRTGSHLATWDDHDYGPNDANSSYAFKQASLNVFERYWPNPSAGLPDVAGVFTRTMRSDVEFFLLDDRWYRDSDKSVVPDKQLFGDAQIAWLRNALLQSPATWKVIVSGSQLFNDMNRFEGWNHFPAERKAFVDWLTAQRVSGVLFLSGDRHFSAAFRRDRDGAYPLHEFTCSPLTARAWPNPGKEASDNPALIPGSFVGQNNFCQLEFDGKRGARALTVQIRDAQGRVAWSKRIEEASLK